MKINKERLLADLYALREFTDTPGSGVTRFSYGEQDAKARKYISDKAAAMSCSISTDMIGNIRIGLASNRPGRKTVMAGSHIDTVRSGGWLDGIYGVCGALEVMAVLSEAGREFSCNYEAVIFAEEEGSGFGSTMTGSKFITGIYTDSDRDKLKNDNGETLRDVLLRWNGGSSAVSWDFDSIKTMLELHIEQGPVLDRAGLSLGIVDTIFGMRVIEVTLSGVGNHAGATPMNERYDALCTAAECILAAEQIVKDDPEKRTVVTAGKMEVSPNCSNVIPETVKFTLEVRDKDKKKIDSFMDRIIDRIKLIAGSRNVGCHIHEHSESAPLPLAARLIDSMSERAAEQKLSYKVMDSGAVHDACMIAAHADTGMIFVPSIDGRSHVPEENTREEHLAAGVQFLLDTVISELE